MKTLRKKIVWYFILCAFILQGVVSSLDSVFSDVISLRLEENEKMFSVALIVFLLLIVLSFALAAFVFYLLTKKAMLAEQKKELEKQSLLYSSLAHDLKTPMTSVMGFSAALSDGKIPSEKTPETAEIIRTKTKMMNELLMEMITLAKTGSSAYMLNKKKVDLCALVRAVTAMEYDAFEQKKITLETDIPETPVFADIDETEFRRAVTNIIVNSYKHNRDGAHVKISVSEENRKHSRLGTKVKILVADDGEKIPAELEKNLFNPFVSGSESRTSGTGSGLGLAITRQIVEKHGGKVGMEDNIDGYTKGFFIEI